MPGAPSRNTAGPPAGNTWIAYKDPSGGLNTRRDSHALDRNMAAMSINFWPAYENALSKRPGSSAAISTTGATGMSGTGTHIVATRWNIGGVSTTVLLAQNGVHLAFAAVNATTWTAISTAMGTGAQRIHVAQMYDPLSGANQCFICNGVDLPWLWAGPGHTTLTQTSVANGLPVNKGGSTGITPRFVETFNGSLFYAGEPTEPTAVFVSNSWYPQAFTQSASSGTNYPGSYQPYLIGYNDGIAGGNITGLGFLQGSVIVFKESALYLGTIANIYGSVYAFVWQCISATRGFIAPESIVAYESIICGLSIDGCWWTDGYQMTQFSSDVPTFFDGSLSGNPATCLAYPTAVAARMGTKYLIFYDRGATGTGAGAAGYPTSGLWFDFGKQTKTGMPEAGEMQGTSSANGDVWACCGMATLAGPNDLGLVAWIDPTQDRVGIFGQGFNDFGAPIAVTFAGPADMIPEVADPTGAAAGISVKNVLSYALNIAAVLGGALTFSAQIVTDLQSSTPSAGVSTAAPSSSLVWGTGSWGQANWGPTTSTSYQAIPFTPAQTAFGKILQFIVQEASTQQWIMLGYELEVGAQAPLI